MLKIKRKYVVDENNNKLGLVCWSGGWWKYIFKTAVAKVEYDNSCFDDISDFLTNLTRLQNASWRKK